MQTKWIHQAKLIFKKQSASTSHFLPLLAPASTRRRAARISPPQAASFLTPPRLPCLGLGRRHKLPRRPDLASSSRSPVAATSFAARNSLLEPLSGRSPLGALRPALLGHLHPKHAPPHGLPRAATGRRLHHKLRRRLPASPPPGPGTTASTRRRSNNARVRAQRSSQRNGKPTGTCRRFP